MHGHAQSCTVMNHHAPSCNGYETSMHHYATSDERTLNEGSTTRLVNNRQEFMGHRRISS